VKNFNIRNKHCAIIYLFTDYINKVLCYNILLWLFYHFHLLNMDMEGKKNKKNQQQKGKHTLSNGNDCCYENV
jgi:hypothetical protein